MPLTLKRIIESKKVASFLIRRRLEQQYKKAKHYLLAANFTVVDFAVRKPKQDRIFYFRINKQYRAWGVLNDEILKVYKIDDHQS